MQVGLERPKYCGGDDDRHLGPATSSSRKDDCKVIVHRFLGRKHRRSPALKGGYPDIRATL